ncbi:nucleotide-binding domain-containing protein [Metschnikowia bicuspidata var. bicuspidata NRRL YB-4993]|uniref:Nucleotide-binding domain-containing protein n=1 Tax=Metschnikowia bicuspidata var. bicuspidata NRRL YB-4993 TaxID=869754 RepID=A0A1A0HES0_9ASCO|nr:nucleotide-binding domain-containing protein [Metschnikowia bicuspidata var. bicuspidata NRRL YB-4993]OBA22470.1 nucleotide-binding domain-containing protein [Metschnikowia bicuspidata var. bicuspidata NRRL YB-4993]
MSDPVVVVGAGVIGLTVALRLKQQFKNIDVTVAATFLPGDLDITYTSPYAGANWQSFALNSDWRQQQIDAEAYHEFGLLAADPRSGIWRKKNRLYYTQTGLDREHGNTGNLVPWHEPFSGGRRLSPEELIPGTVYGREFDGFVVSVPTYLPYLVQRCLELGVVFKRVPKITDISDARLVHSSGRPAQLVVNCAGLLASEIGGVDDPSRNYAVKGQVLVVRNAVANVQIVCGFDRPDEELYVFPRKEGGAIIGGCFYVDNRDPAEDKQLTQRILARALQYLPELVDTSVHGNPGYIDVVGVNVGLRPFREHGPRIEKDARKPWLIHGYGAGGGGYQGSYGFAKEIVALVAEALSAPRL